MNIKTIDFILRQDYFDIRSALHGIPHTCRVMCHCLLLGDMLRSERETKLAVCAAFIHDMARKHDGRCHMHGTWAAENKLPLFRELFLSLGVAGKDLEEIRVSVSNHSLLEELAPDHPFYMTTAILKDADALDRVRLGENNLKTDLLRLPESRELIAISRELYHRTKNESEPDFEKILIIACSLL
ncbi:MAG: hypothetical protein C0402_04430 [Thermodesulfovibrio sp.]|nr:hypothetical protein [Thermodesulfovibrio sp.]